MWMLWLDLVRSGAAQFVDLQPVGFPDGRAIAHDRVDDNGDPVAGHQIDKAETADLAVLDLDVVAVDAPFDFLGDEDADGVVADETVTHPQNENPGHRNSNTQIKRRRLFRAAAVFLILAVATTSCNYE